MLLKKIQDASLEARKSKDAVRADLLVTLYAEAARVGKDAGNRDSTDEEVQRTVRKFLKGVDESLAVLTDIERRSRLLVEKGILEGYLPSVLTEAELSEAVKSIVATLPEKSLKAVGTVMAQLKARFGATYDGAQASKLVKAALSV